MVKSIKKSKHSKSLAISIWLLAREFFFFQLMFRHYLESFENYSLQFLYSFYTTEEPNNLFIISKFLFPLLVKYFFFFLKWIHVLADSFRLRPYFFILRIYLQIIHILIYKSGRLSHQSTCKVPISSTAWPLPSHYLWGPWPLCATILKRYSIPSTTFSLTRELMTQCAVE